MITVNMKSNEKMLLVCTPVNANGDAVPDLINWSASPAGLVSLSPSVDTLSCEVAALGQAGSAMVTAGDGNLSEAAMFVIASVVPVSLGLKQGWPLPVPR